MTEQLIRLPEGRQYRGPARRRLGERVAETYRSGLTIRELAEHLGRSYGFVHRLLAEQGAVRTRQDRAGIRLPG